MNGKELQRRIDASFDRAYDDIQLMRREELYKDLGCRTFKEYYDVHLQGKLTRFKWDRLDRQEVAAELYKGGMTIQQTARELGVVQSTVSRDLREQGIVEKNNSRGRPRKHEPESITSWEEVDKRIEDAKVERAEDPELETAGYDRTVHEFSKQVRLLEAHARKLPPSEQLSYSQRKLVSSTAHALVEQVLPILNTYTEEHEAGFDRLLQGE
jgi:transposase-like protein